MNFYKKYILFVLGSIFTFLCTISILNYIIDPYAIYNFIILKGINDKKPLINGRTRLHKTQKLYTHSFDCIFLGTSRVEASFDFDSNSIFFEHCKNYYNAGLSFANILEVYYLMELIQKYQKKPKIFIGLDFLQFNAKAITISKELDFFRKPMFIRYANLISYSVLKDSLKTIHAKEDSFYKANGSWKIEENYKEKFPKNTSLFLIFLLTENGFYDIFYNHFDFTNNKLSTLNYFEKILDISYSHNLEVYFFINPFHVRLLQLLDYKIGYNQFEEWKKYLVEIISKKAEQWNQTPYPLWDFSGYNSITTEPIDQNIKSSKYFYDSSHLKREIGELILGKILSISSQISDFGVPLNKTTIQKHLEEQRKRKTKWEQDNKEITKELLNFAKSEYKLP
ncbi:MAG: hypothetical protein ACK4UJ_11825 [Leptonema sp. (in: bacteria)]